MKVGPHGLVDPGGVGSLATLAEESALPIITPAHYQSRLRELQVIAGEDSFVILGRSKERSDARRP